MDISDLPFITMNGPQAILDCDGHTISSIDRGEGVGVRLLNGASMINCNIANVERAVQIWGDGCSTVQNVATSFTDNDAIQVQGTGKSVLNNIFIESSDNDGIEVNVLNEVVTGELLVIMSDITISGTFQNGICLLDNAPNGTTVELYGDISIEKSEVHGLSIDGGDFNVTAFCNLLILGSDNIGISLDDSVVTPETLTFAQGSKTTSCFNFGNDIGGIDGSGNTGSGGFVKEMGATVQCDNTDDVGNFECDRACVILPETSTLGIAPGCVEFPLQPHRDLSTGKSKNVRRDEVKRDLDETVRKTRKVRTNMKPQCRTYSACPNFLTALDQHGMIVKGTHSDRNNGRSKAAEEIPYNNKFCDRELVSCNSTFQDTAVTLTGDLYCKGDDFFVGGIDLPFITMDGPDAILDCAGHRIFSTTTDPVAGVGVQVRNGASVINCKIGNVQNAVAIEGDGCSTVMNVQVSFTNDDAIQVKSTGTAVLSKLLIESVNSNGIVILDPEITTGELLVIMSDITVSGTYNNGIELSRSAPNGTKVELYGEITVEKSDDNSFVIQDDGFEVTANCKLSVLGGDEDGIRIRPEFSNFTFARGSSTTSCFNFGDDLDGTARQDESGGFNKEEGATLQCDIIVDSGVFDNECDEPCVIVPESSTVGIALGCLS